MCVRNGENSAVFDSLQLAIKWLRDSVQQNKSIRFQVRCSVFLPYQLWKEYILHYDYKCLATSIYNICSLFKNFNFLMLTYQVLVTGSLHLVGDVLRIVKK